jgi:hypothetical protein
MSGKGLIFKIYELLQLSSQRLNNLIEKWSNGLGGRGSSGRAPA